MVDFKPIIHSMIDKLAIENKFNKTIKFNLKTIYCVYIHI